MFCIYSFSFLTNSSASSFPVLFKSSPRDDGYAPEHEKGLTPFSMKKLMVSGNLLSISSTGVSNVTVT